jgi:hypothetical protein
MAASLQMQIISAIKALLTTPAMTSVAAENVRTDPIFPADLLEGTALNIELGDEPEPNRFVLGFKDRNVEVKLTSIATGENALADVDALMVESHDRLLTDSTLGGLCFDINELGTTRLNSANGPRLAVIEKTYSVNFRTAETTLQN